MDSDKAFKKFVLEVLQDIIKHDKVNLSFQIKMMESAIGEDAEVVVEVDDLSGLETGIKERRERIAVAHLHGVREAYEQRLEDIASMLAGLDLDGISA